MEKVDKIELRSEKVRHIISEIPPSIVRYGIMVITFIVFGLLVASYFIPYPETIDVKAVALDSKKIKVPIPYRYVNTIKAGMKAGLEFDGYDAEEYGYIDGTVTYIDRKPIANGEENQFVVFLSVNTGRYKVEKGMVGSTNILITSESILQRMLHRITNSE